MDEKIAANIIVDLYEMRATANRPLQPNERENIYLYNILTTIIANLCDKYKIKHFEIDEVLRERSFQRIKQN